MDRLAPHPLDPPGRGKNQLFIMRADGKGDRQLTHMPPGANPGHAKWGTLG